MKGGQVVGAPVAIDDHVVEVPAAVLAHVGVLADHYRFAEWIASLRTRHCIVDGMQSSRVRNSRALHRNGETLGSSSSGPIVIVSSCS